MENCIAAESYIEILCQPTTMHQDIVCLNESSEVYLLSKTLGAGRITMKILAIDSSGLVASTAVVSEEGMLAEYTVNYKKTHSQTMLPMIQKILSMLELQPAGLDTVAVSAGPDSFTGLRIGAAAAKGLGQQSVMGIEELSAILRLSQAERERLEQEQKENKPRKESTLAEEP